MEKGIFHRLNALLVESNVWIALGSAAFATQTYFTLKLDVSDTTFWLTAIIAFSSTFSAYHFHRKYATLRKSGLKGQSATFVMILGGVITAGISWILLDHLKSAIILLPVALLSLYYVVPSRVYPEAPPIRERGGVKIWVIALCWALLGTWFPLSVADSLGLSKGYVWLIMIEKLAFVAGITIPFDVRDLYEDPPELRTIPQQIGPGKSLIVGGSLILLSMAMVVTLNQIGQYSWEVMWALIASYLLSIALIAAASRPRPRWYYTGAIDGLLILQPLLAISAVTLS